MIVVPQNAADALRTDPILPKNAKSTLGDSAGSVCLRSSSSLFHLVPSPRLQRLTVVLGRTLATGARVRPTTEGHT